MATHAAPSLRQLVDTREHHTPQGLNALKNRVQDVFGGSHFRGLIKSMKDTVWMVPPYLGGMLALEYFLEKGVFQPLNERIYGKQEEAEPGPKELPIKQSVFRIFNLFVWFGATYTSLSFARFFARYGDDVVAPMAAETLLSASYHAAAHADNPLIADETEAAKLLSNLRKLPSSLDRLAGANTDIAEAKQKLDASLPKLQAMQQRSASTPTHQLTAEEQATLIQASADATALAETVQKHIGASHELSLAVQGLVASHAARHKEVMALVAPEYQPGFANRVLHGNGTLPPADDVQSSLNVVYQLLYTEPKLTVQAGGRTRTITFPHDTLNRLAKEVYFYGKSHDLVNAGEQHVAFSAEDHNFADKSLPSLAGLAKHALAHVVAEVEKQVGKLSDTELQGVITAIENVKVLPKVQLLQGPQANGKLAA